VGDPKAAGEPESGHETGTGFAATRAMVCSFPWITVITVTGRQ
jgi:hypothetical protein